MVGKAPNLEPNVGRAALKGAALTYYNGKLQRWITRAYPQVRPIATPSRLRARREFSAVVKLIKLVHSETQMFAADMTKNSTWLTRDFLMSLAFGKALIVNMADGTQWMSIREAFPQVQAMLDSITDVRGSMLIRFADGWRGFSPVGTTAGQILTSNGPGLEPTYEDAPASGVQTVTPGDGIDASITGTDIAIALAEIATSKILGNFHGANHSPDVYSLEQILETLGNTQGEIIYRDASGWTVLSAGAANQVLVSNGTALGWLSVGGGGLATEPSINRFITAPAHPGFDPAMVFNTSITLTNNNKDAQPTSSSPYNYAYGSPAQYTGKRYFEFVVGSVSFAAYGVAGAGGHCVDIDAGSPGEFGKRFAGQVGWYSDGTVKATEWTGNGTGTTLATYATYAATNVLSFALDIDAALIWFRVGSGNWNNNGANNPATGVGGLFIPQLFSGAANGLVWPGCNMGNTAKSSLHVLAADFAQTVPSGFAAWSP